MSLCDASLEMVVPIITAMGRGETETAADIRTVATADHISLFNRLNNDNCSVYSTQRRNSWQLANVTTHLYTLNRVGTIQVIRHTWSSDHLSPTWPATCSQAYIVTTYYSPTWVLSMSHLKTWWHYKTIHFKQYWLVVWHSGTSFFASTKLLDIEPG